MNPFAPLIGQDLAVQLLLAACDRDRLAPAYLFAGPDGTGRGLAARCWAPLLLADQSGRVARGNHPDLLWVEPTYSQQGTLIPASQAQAQGIQRRTPPQVRLEQIRQITQFLARPPLAAPRSLVVIEQAETMAEAAANGLLKTLEEPGQATIILMAPSPELLLPTLVSRCQRIPFYRLSEQAMAQILQTHGFTEILDAPAVLALAQGSPGAAISHWQQLQAIPPELRDRLQQRPNSLQVALELAQAIDAGLDVEAQLWLCRYLQQQGWSQQQLQSQQLLQLEQAQKQLRAFVQPRLVWEVLLSAWVQEAEGN
ncbi:DNA polymerase III subunit delta' [Synechococcus elongatus]|uniref:DNA polymerase III subunit delta' n=1 Tax=Synechococcus elongatus TaxID=32046 RepID=UPI000F7F6B86|nr:DNA polymerase III subunit delta' [Synechococcus elongatus]